MVKFECGCSDVSELGTDGAILKPQVIRVESVAYCIKHEIRYRYWGWRKVKVIRKQLKQDSSTTTTT